MIDLKRHYINFFYVYFSVLGLPAQLVKKQVLAPISINQNENNIDQENQEMVGFCSDHKKPLELICVDDKCRVCSSCALFGKHRGHDVQEETQVQENIMLKVNELLEVHQVIIQAQAQLENDSVYREQHNLFLTAKEQLIAQIQKKFKSWRTHIRSIETKMLDQLHNSFAPTAEEFNNSKQEVYELRNKLQFWNSKAEAFCDNIEKQTQENSHYIAYELLDKQVMDDYFIQSEELQVKFEELKGYKKLDGIDSKYQQINLEFEPDFEKRVNNLFKVYNNYSEPTDTSGDITSNQLSSFARSFDDQVERAGVTVPVGGLNMSGISFNNEEIVVENCDNLLTGADTVNTSVGLLNISNEVVNISSNSGNISNNSIGLATLPMKVQDICASPERKTNLPQQQSRGGEAFKIPKPSSNSQNVSVEEVKQEQKKPQMIKEAKRSSITAPGLKLKGKDSKISLAFKESTYEVDLSNQSLTNMHVNEICKYLKQVPTLHTLNLDGNKLSDEGLIQLGQSICETQLVELILSNNKITDKALEPLAAILRTNKAIKTLDLQGNGLQSRVAKNKLKNTLTWVDAKF